MRSLSYSSDLRNARVLNPVVVHLNRYDVSVMLCVEPFLPPSAQRARAEFQVG